MALLLRSVNVTITLTHWTKIPQYLPCVGGVGLKVRVGLSCRLPGGEAPGDTVNSFGGPESSLDKLVTDSDDSLGLVAV